MLALVTCADARSLDTDLPFLVAELPEARVVVWDDPQVDWAGFERVVIRSAWDYHRDPGRFLSWAREVAAVTDLWNRVDVVEWNIDKQYLHDLRAQQVPTVPTTALATVAEVDEHERRGGFSGALVVKPSVGVSASGVLATHDAAAAAAHARSLLAAGMAPLVQPYLDGVDGHGETGLVYLGGTFSHAFGRRVVLRAGAELDGDLLGEEESAPRRASDAERAVGEAVMAVLPPTAYARVDLLPTSAGPVVLEVELIEPSLFLHLDPDAPARAAAAFRSL